MISGTRYRLTMEINRQLSLARSIERSQVEISTGKRIQAPSDDPVGAGRVAEIGRTQANELAWRRNLDSAFAMSARADTLLGSVGSVLDRANELMVSAANGTLSAENRATIALELRSIAEELNMLKQSRDARGEPLFPASEPLRIPVGDGTAVIAVASRERVFESVQTAAGARDMAAIVSAAADALMITDDDARQAAIDVSLDEVGAALIHSAAARGEQGARGNRIDNMLERLANTKLQLAEERSAMESTDVTEVIARLQSQKLTLDAAQAVFARVNQSTLFDILR